MKIIFKKNFSTATFELDVKSTDSGKELRELIAQQDNVAPEEVQLKFWGDVIQNDVTVADYKMKDQDTIIYQIIKKKAKVADGSAEQAGAQPKTIQLTLNQAGQPELKVEVVPEDSIAIVKKKIEQAHGIPDAAIKLKHNNMIMFPAKRLQDYGIEADTSVELLVDQKLAEQAQKTKTDMDEEKKKQGNGNETKGEVQLKVKFHDGDEKTVTANSEHTMEELRVKLLELKPINKETHNLKVVVGGESRNGETKIKDLGISDKVVVATVLEKVKGADDVSLVIKRSVGAETTNITVNKNQTVEELKKLLEEPLKAKASEITLQNAGGSDLEDGKTIVDSGVQDGATLTVSVVKKGLFSNK